MRFTASVFTAIFATSAAVSAQTPTIRIRAARVVDGTGKSIANATIVVQGSTIAAIETASSGPVDYDLGSLTVVPGLIDVHSHVGWHFGPDGRYQPRAATPAQEILYSAENAYVTLMAGFTTIQSPGQANDVELRAATGRGVFPGPRLLTSIRQLNENSGTPDQIREAVRQLKKEGADASRYSLRQAFATAESRR